MRSPGALWLSMLMLVNRPPGWDAPVSQKALTLDGTSPCTFPAAFSRQRELTWCGAPFPF